MYVCMYVSTAVMNQDDPIVKAATDATQEYHKKAGGDTPQWPLHCYAWMGMLEVLVSEDMGLGEEKTQSIRQLCQEYASAKAMVTVIHVCRVKKAFQKGKVKVFRSARLR